MVNWFQIVTQQQVALLRQRLDSRASLNDQLRTELRRAKTELEAHGISIREKTNLWYAATAELQAAAVESADALKSRDEQVNSLRCRLETIGGVLQELEKKRERCTQLAALNQEITSHARAREVEFEYMTDRWSAEEAELRFQLNAAEITCMETAQQENHHELIAAHQGVKDRGLQTSVQFKVPLSSQIQCNEEKPELAAELAEAEANTRKQCKFFEVGKAAEAALRMCSDKLQACRLELEHTTADTSMSIAKAHVPQMRQLAQLKAEVVDFQKAAKEAESRAEALRSSLVLEQELHQETRRSLRAQHAACEEQRSELHQELDDLSRLLEQKEDDILSMQFDMVALQNELSDQRHKEETGAALKQLEMERDNLLSELERVRLENSKET